MKIIPTWPIAALCLAVGVAAGGVSTRYVYVHKIDKIQAQYNEELRQREVQRVKDEVAARQEEQRLSARAGQIEQEKANEIARIRSDSAAAIARLQNRSARPSSTGSVSSPTTNCQGATGAELYREDAAVALGIARDADEQREALRACYAAYDSLR